MNLTTLISILWLVWRTRKINFCEKLRVLKHKPDLLVQIFKMLRASDYKNVADWFFKKLNLPGNNLCE